MKTIYGLFIVSIMGLLLFSGVNVINQYMFLKGTLDSNSQNLVLQYDNNLNNLIQKYNTTYNGIYENKTSLLEKSSNVNTLNAYIMEYGESKQKINILRQGMNMVTQIPDMLLFSVPFISANNLKSYKSVLFLVIIFIIGIALARALFQRRFSDSS